MPPNEITLRRFFESECVAQAWIRDVERNGVKCNGAHFLYVSRHEMESQPLGFYAVTVVAVHHATGEAITVEPHCDANTD